MKRIVPLTALAVACTRLLAVARTPWDWDEMLFILGMRHYDVAAHHPHPPGFPLFLAAAKVFGFLGDFRALQLVVLLGALAVFPAMYFFCRRLELDAPSSALAALVLAFLPNVWFYGGTALSDVPSMVLGIAAAAFFFSNGGQAILPVLPAGLVAGIALSFRPQNALLLIVPVLLALKRDTRRTLLAILIMAIIAIASYGAAAAITGPAEWLRVMREHQRYITSTDSFLAPTRPPLWKLADDFFFWPFREPAINIALALLALLALLRPSRATLLAIGTFAPFALFAWLFLDHNSASRFSVAYMPLVAFLAAAGLARLGRFRWPLAAALIVLMCIITMPALRIVRTTIAPPIAATNWLRAHANPAAMLYVDKPLMPYVDAELPAFALIQINDPGMPAAFSDGPSYYVAEAPGAVTFNRPHDHLWNIARRRYFTTSVTPLLRRVAFVEGWQRSERSGREVVRWMSGSRAVAILPADTTHFALSLYLPSSTDVTISLDGVVLERVHANGPWLDRSYRANGRQLVIETGGPKLRLEWITVFRVHPARRRGIAVTHRGEPRDDSASSRGMN